MSLILSSQLSRRRLLHVGGTLAASFAMGPVKRSAAQSPAASAFPTTWTFGDVTVTKVVDLLDPFDAARAYPGAPLDAFDENASWLVPHFYDPAQKAILFSFHSYIVRTPRRTMVFETGIGNDKVRKTLTAFNMRRGPYLDNLRAAGVRPEDVDVVASSHFHSDHIGWNTRRQEERWVPTFPKAKYLFSRAEVANVQNRIADGTGDLVSYNDSIRPILDSGQAEVIDRDTPVDDGVTIVASTGHTPGHQSVNINSKGRRAVLAGDILHNPIEVLHPEWICVFDQDKTDGIKGRQVFLDAHTDVDITVFAAHFGGPTAGHIVSDKNGRRTFKTLVG